MVQQNNEYRQTPMTLVAKALTRWWWLGFLTLGIIIIWDILEWKRAALVLKDESLLFKFGVITQNSREVPYRNAQTVEVHQSVLGQMLGYGHIVITTANTNAPIEFKYVAQPQMVREAIQARINNHNR